MSVRAAFVHVSCVLVFVGIYTMLRTIEFLGIVDVVNYLGSTASGLWMMQESPLKR